MQYYESLNADEPKDFTEPTKFLDNVLSLEYTEAKKEGFVGTIEEYKKLRDYT